YGPELLIPCFLIYLFPYLTQTDTFLHLIVEYKYPRNHCISSYRNRSFFCFYHFSNMFIQMNNRCCHLAATSDSRLFPTTHLLFSAPSYQRSNYESQLFLSPKLPTMYLQNSML